MLGCGLNKEHRMDWTLCFAGSASALRLDFTAKGLVVLEGITQQL
jgi:hypothetical protein